MGLGSFGLSDRKPDSNQLKQNKNKCIDSKNEKSQPGLKFKCHQDQFFLLNFSFFCPLLSFLLLCVVSIIKIPSLGSKY